jgi:hypothetical protein
MSTWADRGSALTTEPPSSACPGKVDTGFPKRTCANIIILTFIIGQDRAGHWIVRETHGLGGGIFVSRDAALAYAEFETDHRPGAVRLTTQSLEFAA